MTAEQRKAIEILNKIRDCMKDELSEDDYMYLMGMVLDSKTDTVYVPYNPLSPYITPHDSHPLTWPTVTYTCTGLNTK